MERSNTHPNTDEKSCPIKAGSINWEGYILSLQQEIEFLKRKVVRLEDHIAEKEEEDDTQYKKPCCKCGHILCIDTPIMCYSNAIEGDMTLCSKCYWDNDFWWDDENEDNRDEIKEYMYDRRWVHFQALGSSC